MNSAPPPYIQATWVHNKKLDIRVYKHGAGLGAAIYEGDPIYFVFYKISNHLDGGGPDPLYADTNPWYLGSTNQTIDYNLVYNNNTDQTYFANNSAKEIFWYIANGTTTQPPNLATNFLWNAKIENSQLAEYTALNPYSNYIRLFSPTFYNWPAAGNNQW